MIEHVLGPDGRFIIRAEADSVAGVRGLHSFNHVIQLIQRVTRRPERWTITIRRAEHDPLGEVLFRRSVADRSAAEDAVRELTGDVRRRSLPIA